MYVKNNIAEKIIGKMYGIVWIDKILNKLLVLELSVLPQRIKYLEMSLDFQFDGTLQLFCSTNLKI